LRAASPLQVTDDLKNFLTTNLPKVKKDGKAKFKLGVAEAKLGSAIQVLGWLRRSLLIFCQAAKASQPPGRTTEERQQKGGACTPATVAAAAASQQHRRRRLQKAARRLQPTQRFIRCCSLCPAGGDEHPLRVQRVCGGAAAWSAPASGHVSPAAPGCCRPRQPPAARSKETPVGTARAWGCPQRAPCHPLGCFMLRSPCPLFPPPSLAWFPLLSAPFIMAPNPWLPPTPLTSGTSACATHLPRSFIKGLEDRDMARAQLGLAHSYSRAKVKFNVNKVDNMIIQVGLLGWAAVDPWMRGFAIDPWMEVCS
jgi:hypothetical protein